MSNDNFDDYDDAQQEEGGGFLDHLFNAIGHLSRAQRQAQAKRQATSEAPKLAGGKRIKAFDAAPDSSCCIAKRGE